MPKISLPHNWHPRRHQLKLWSYLENGGKRAVEIAHRRWGKDDVALHRTACAAHERPATYWHMLPEYSQARKAIWNAINPHTGKRRIDEAFPKELRASTNEQEMFIRFKWGSSWQVIGSDNYQSLVGTPPAGIVFSEWARANPGAWAYLAPILVENGGWALFITTPVGRNHAKNLLDLARGDPKWFSEVQTIDDSGAIERDMVEQQRKEYHALFGQEAGDALIEQEYWCSFNAAVLGSYWGKEINAAEREGRICKVDPIPGYPVNTAWDIGVDDPMAIWVYQVGPGWLNVIDYYEASGHGFEHYAKWLNDRNYTGGIDWVPHDARMREPSAPEIVWTDAQGKRHSRAKTRIETLIELKRKPVLVPDHKPIDRINAARKTLPLAKFDAERCAKGLDCLREYRAEYDETNRVFKKTPLHNWASHGADAWGHLSVAWSYPNEKPKPKEIPLRGAENMTVNELLKLSKPASKWI